jgi:glycosyl transferase family 25
LPIPAATIAFLQNYFDKIFVVSVPRFTDRHKRVSENLKGLSFDFFWGADKLQLDPAKLENVYDEATAMKMERQGKGLNTGEVACSLSHRMVYEEMIRHSWNKVLIFEDDVLPLANVLDQLPAALEELPPGWELVYLGYLKHEKITLGLKAKQFFYRVFSGLGLMKWSYPMVSNLLPRKYSSHLKKAGFHDCTHAYAINLEAAKKLSAAQTPVVYRADDLLSNTIMKGKLDAYITEPKFFDQEIFYDPAIASEVKN